VLTFVAFVLGMGMLLIVAALAEPLRGWVESTGGPT
jgi:hypothetical protein